MRINLSVSRMHTASAERHASARNKSKETKYLVSSDYSSQSPRREVVTRRRRPLEAMHRDEGGRDYFFRRKGRNPRARASASPISAPGRVRGTDECNRPTDRTTSRPLRPPLPLSFATATPSPSFSSVSPACAHMCAGHEVAFLAVRREALARSPPPRWHRDATLPPLLHVARAAMPEPVCE